MVAWLERVPVGGAIKKVLEHGSAIKAHKLQRWVQEINKPIVTGKRREHYYVSPNAEATNRTAIMDLIFGLSEVTLRLSVFIGIFVLMALLELLKPRRKLEHSKSRRWITNISIVAFNSLIVRLMGMFVVPLLAVTTAFWAENNSWGLLNLVDWPAWLEILIAVVLFDLAIYGQHVASHKLPILWLFHRMHHADVDFDVTTGSRFHPVEIALSMLYKIVIVLILGPRPEAVVIFEILLNGTAMFNHANFKLPLPVDRLVRSIFVTPDMHRVHHSIIHRETDSNYGFNLSVWDRIFSTYNDQPQKGHEHMTIGLPYYQSEKPTGLLWCLKLPFTGSDREGERASDNDRSRIDASQ